MKSTSEVQKIIETLQSCESIGENAQEYYHNLLKHHQEIDNSSDFQSKQEILKALGNRDRLMIIELLSEKDRCVCELEAALQKSQPSISRHLKILEDANLIQGWKHGKFTHYSLIKGTFHKFLQQFTTWYESVCNWLQNLHS